MLPILDILFLGFHAVAQPIYVRTDQALTLPALGEVVYKEGFKPALFSEPCRYAGVVVAYEHDWEERRDIAEGHEITLRPDGEKGQIKGYAFLINREKCPDQPARRVSYIYGTTGTAGASKVLGTPGYQIQALPFHADVQKNFPWFPQVMACIETAAATGNSAAQGYLQFIRDNSGAAGESQP